MTLYFDYKVQNPDPTAINVGLEWHPVHPLLAVASYSQEKGGIVTLYDELGDVVKGVNYPQHPVAQVTILAWHPSRKLLVTGWENGELRVWSGGNEFVAEQSPHQAPITILQWSLQGGRLVSGDASGSLAGFRLDAKGHIVPAFHHDLKDPLTHIVFRRSRPDVDIGGLARAAVAGDEKALDMFSAWRPRTASQRISFQSGGENMCFFVGSVSGIVYYFTEEGKCTEVLKTDGSLLKKLLYREGKDHLILMTEGLNVGQFQVDAQGNVSEITKIKISGRAQEANIIWAGSSLLAMTAGELIIRFWDLETGENYVLEFSGTKSNSLPTEIFTGLAYCSRKQILAGGTNLGNIVLWKREDLVEDEPEKSWVRQTPCNVHGAVKQLAWAGGESWLGVNTITNVLMLKEQSLCACYNKGVSAVQISPSRLYIECNDLSLELKTDLQVKGVAVNSDHIAAWSNKMLVVYLLSTEEEKLYGRVVGSFSCEAESVHIYEQTVIVLSHEKLQLHTFQGTVKQTLIFSDDEGQPIGAELCGGFLVVTTTNGILKMWDLSRREAKVHGHPKDVASVIDDFTEIILARCNSTGTRVSISVAKSNFLPDSKLFLWDVDNDSLQYFDLATGHVGDEAEYSSLGSSPVPADSGSLGCIHRFPLSHYWDVEDPKLLVCEAKLLPTSLSKIGKGKKKMEDLEPEVTAVSFFSCPEVGLVIQDILSFSDSRDRLLGVHTPHLVVLARRLKFDSITAQVKHLLMRDFEGLESSDKETREAILAFSYNLTIGNMDEAFRAIKTIKSEAVWESLAKMCVKTRRADVASVCLGHMKHARGAMAVRLASEEPEPEARLAMLAIQVGLIDEAERLYKSCGRFDLLNRLYQAGGEWEKALRIAEEHDRIHLRSTYFSYAKHLESKGEIEGAIRSFEKADAHRSQVPRMLLDDPVALEAYVLRTKDRELTKWWAQYMESSGQMDVAIKNYENAGDYYSLVRILCFQDELSRAAEIAESTGDGAACYHLARQYESMGQIHEAVHFFAKAKAYGNAIRICKEHGMDEAMWKLAVLAGPREQIEAAQYLEKGEKGIPEKAVLLYHQAGMLHKALDLAFKTHRYDVLRSIAVDLSSTSDPALILKCSEFFVQNSEYEKAVDLLAVGKRYAEALAICLEHDIPITEDLAEKLTFAKGEGDEELRVKVLETIAESALAQRNYHLATKKFTQAGNKVKAMKALLKSGDTQKIVFFANVSRQKDIYVMAANYLQSLDWKTDPAILKNIVTFYGKGKAPDLLANFYVACAQVEVDEYQNYEKALGALNEAHRCLDKITNPQDPARHNRALENLNSRITMVKKFLDARRTYERGDRDSADGQCRQLLKAAEDSDCDPVRPGDVYGLMIEARVASGDIRIAQQLVEEFRRTNPGVNVTHYVRTDILEKIMPVSHFVQVEDSISGVEDEEYIEEIVEERPYTAANGRAHAL